MAGDHSDFVPYPTELPAAAYIALVMDALRYRQVDVKEAAHGAYHLLGYGLGKWDSHPALTSNSGTLTEEEAAQLLEELTRVHGDKAARDAAAVAMPWALLIPLLMELIKRLLNG